jgi:hypothetical protein
MVMRGTLFFDKGKPYRISLEFGVKAIACGGINNLK